jgi:hypothetical protein
LVGRSRDRHLASACPQPRRSPLIFHPIPNPAVNNLPLAAKRRLGEIAAGVRRAEEFRNAVLQEGQRAALVRQCEEIVRDIRDFYFPVDPDAPDVDLGRDPITRFQKIKRGDFCCLIRTSRNADPREGRRAFYCATAERLTALLNTEWWRNLTKRHPRTMRVN